VESSTSACPSHAAAVQKIHSKIAKKATTPNAFCSGDFTNLHVSCAMSGRHVFALVLVALFSAVPHAMSSVVPLMHYTNYTLSVPRYGLTAVSVCNTAIFAGGVEAQTVSKAVDMFDLASGLWTTTALSVARSNAAATSVGNLALIAGGSDSSGQKTSVVEFFNCSSRLWTTASLSVARSLLAATSVSGFALFAGGSEGSGDSVPSSVVDIFDHASNLWTTAVLSAA
jgi:hypothetical protein